MVRIVHFSLKNEQLCQKSIIIFKYCFHLCKADCTHVDGVSTMLCSLIQHSYWPIRVCIGKGLYNKLLLLIFKIPNLEELTRRHLFEQYSQQGHHETKIEKCMQELTEILGDSIPRRELLRITLAADCDVNRALNFYFSWQSSEI